MSEGIIIALITAVGSLLGGVIGQIITASATIEAAKIKEKTNTPQNNGENNSWKRVVMGAIIGAIVTLIILFTLGMLPPKSENSQNSTPDGTTAESNVPKESVTEDSSVLFYEDFEDGKAQQVWNILGDWQVIKDETGNYVYDIDNSKNAEGPCIDFGSSNWGDYVIKYKFRVFDTGTGSWTAIAFRRNQTRMAQYIFSIDLYNVGLHYSGLDGQWHNMINRSYSMKRETWYWVQVEANGTNLDIFIDDVPIINTEDTLHSTGTLELCGGPYSHAQFDNIEVSTINK